MIIPGKFLSALSYGAKRAKIEAEVNKWETVGLWRWVHNALKERTKETHKDDSTCVICGADVEIEGGWRCYECYTNGEMPKHI